MKVILAMVVFIIMMVILYGFVLMFFSCAMTLYREEMEKANDKNESKKVGIK